MDFSLHKEFRAKLYSQYSEHYESYPNASLVLDYLFQLLTHSQYENSWVDQWDIDLYISTIVKDDFTTRFYCHYITLFSFIFFFRKKQLTIHSSLVEDKFPGINSILQEIADKKDGQLILQDNPVRILDALFLRSFYPYRSFIGQKTKKLIKQFEQLNKDQIIEKLNDRNFMHDLDKSVLSDVNRTAKLIERLNINIFFNSGDSSANARVLIQSLKNTGRKVFSFAHGYITEETLLGIVPVYSQKLILWTEKQKSDISKFIPKNYGSKLSFIGFPKNFKISKHNNSSGILLIMGYIEPILEDVALSKLLKKTVNTLKQYDDITIRLHPHERENRKIVDRFIEDNELIKSFNELRDDIDTHRFILGANTSAMIEAASTGKKIYELAELKDKKMEFEGIDTIQIEDLDLILSNKNDETHHSSRENLWFDKDLLKRNLEELIYDLN